MVCVGAAADTMRRTPRKDCTMNPMSDMINGNSTVDVSDVQRGPRGAAPGRAAPQQAARQLREQLADERWLEDLLAGADQSGVRLTGPGGFLPELIKAVLEKGLAAELTDHLGYGHGERIGRASCRERVCHNV